MRLSIPQFFFVSVVVCGLLCSCGKKPKAEALPEVSGSSPLKDGTGAVMVIFPREAEGESMGWMAQVTLLGMEDNHSLPRIPFPQSRAMLVLNIPPANYRVIAHAWFQHAGASPHAGGSLPDVVVRAGEITMLKAPLVTKDRYPYAETALTPLKSTPWTLNSSTGFREYVAELVQKTTKG